MTSDDLNTDMRNIYFFFFFQAEDGIRDYKVTGVQTCALPIWPDVRLIDVATKAAAQMKDRLKDQPMVLSTAQLAIGQTLFALWRPKEAYDLVDRKSVV